ncbi:hypothetical protein ACEP24_27130 [Pseudomonas aeruginosa]
MITHLQLNNLLDHEADRLGDVECCKCLADFIMERASSGAVYSYTDFMQACHKSPDDLSALADLQVCINILKSPRVGLLKEEYRYIADDETIYDVSVSDLQVAFEDGALHVDGLGYSDVDYLSKVYIVFVVDGLAVEK